MEALSRYLSGLGIGEDDLLVLMRESLEAVAGPHLSGAPQSDLPRGELDLLRRGGFPTDLEAAGRNDPLLAGALDLWALVATAFTVEEAARLLGVSPGRIGQRLRGERPSLYGLKWHRRWALPRFQFTDEGELPGLAGVLQRLDRELSPVAVVHWFFLPSPDLVSSESEEPLSPRDWLLAGQSPSEVERLASAL